MLVAADKSIADNVTWYVNGQSLQVELQEHDHHLKLPTSSC